MMSRRITAALSLAILAIFALAQPARSGGLYNSEFGTPTLGTASAGASAGTDGASTAIHNPATMTRLDEHQPSSEIRRPIRLERNHANRPGVRMAQPRKGRGRQCNRQRRLQDERYVLLRIQCELEEASLE